MRLKDYLRPGNGATDITPLLGNLEAFRETVKRLSGLFEDTEIQTIVCVEGRGLLLGGAVAYERGCGVVPVRYPGKLKNAVYAEKFVDYSGREKELQIHQDALAAGQKVLVIDDWLETGETVLAAIRLIEKCGGKVGGVGVFMDDSSMLVQQKLAKYNYRYLEKVTPEDRF